MSETVTRAAVVVLAVLLVLGGCATAPPAAAADAPAVDSMPPVWLLVALLGIGALLVVLAVQVSAVRGGPY